MYACKHVFTSSLYNLKLQSWYKVEIFNADDLCEIMTLDDAKMKIYPILKIVFFLLYVCFKIVTLKSVLCTIK